MSAIYSYLWPKANEQVVVPDKYPFEDKIPASMYLALDWSKHVVGGSYALKQFIRAQWMPNDVDIFGLYDNRKEFEDECLKFQQKANLKLVKEVWNQGWQPGCENPIVLSVEDKLKREDKSMTQVDQDFMQMDIQEEKQTNLPTIEMDIKEEKQTNLPTIENDKKDDYVEDFDSSIMGTKTYESNDLDIKIQMIGISRGYLDAYKPGIKTITEALNTMTDVPACVNYYLHNGTKIFNVPEKGLKSLFTGIVDTDKICKKRIEKYRERGFTFV